ncbi:hypothetical protein FACS1894204_04590 [Synergistales bacterium]|nr:hypothetical protein FACS1894204_04590 [Synergistales bacterium]
MNTKREVDRRAGGSVMKTSHRGFVLPLVMIMMLFLVIMCGAVLAMSQMNIKYDSTFEQWSVMEHATMSVAQIMAYKISASGDTWFSGVTPPAQARGSFDMTTYTPPMWFTYDIQASSDSAAGRNRYTLTVNGGYNVGGATETNKRTWGVKVKNIRSGDSTFEWEILSRDI